MIPVVSIALQSHFLFFFQHAVNELMSFAELHKYFLPPPFSKIAICNLFKANFPFCFNGFLLLYPLDTVQKLNVHQTFRKRPGRLLNVLCTFNLSPVSRGSGNFCRVVQGIVIKRNICLVRVRNHFLNAEIMMHLRFSRESNKIVADCPL